MKLDAYESAKGGVGDGAGVVVSLCFLAASPGVVAVGVVKGDFHEHGE